MGRVTLAIGDRVDPTLHRRLRTGLCAFSAALDASSDGATPENLHELRTTLDEMMRAAAGIILALSPQEVSCRALGPTS